MADEHEQKTNYIQEILKDLRDRTEFILAEMKDSLGVDEAYIIRLPVERIDEAGEVLDIIGSIKEINIEKALPKSSEKLENGIPVVGNIDSFTPEEQQSLRECGVSFLAITPLSTEGKCSECLVCSSKEKKDWDMKDFSSYMEYTARISKIVLQMQALASVERDKFLLDNANEVILSYNAKGVVTSVSNAFERITPFRCSDLVGRSIFDFLRPEDHDMARQRLKQLRQGISEPHEYRIGEKWYRFNCHPVMEGGRLKEVVSIMSDVTEIKRAETNLRQSEEKYRIVTEKIKDMVSMWSMDLRPLYVNPAVEELLGYTPQDFLKIYQELSPFDIIAPRSRKILQEVIDERMGPDPGPNVPERQAPVELELVTKDGKRVWTETKFSFLRDEHGDRTAIIAVTRDINKRLRMLKEPDVILDEVERFLFSRKYMIWITDMESTLTYVSPSVKDITGYTQEQFMGMEFGRFMDDISLQRLTAAFEEGLIYARRKTAEWHTVLDIKHGSKHGRSYKAKVILSLLRRGRAGKASGFLGIVCYNL